MKTANGSSSPLKTVAQIIGNAEAARVILIGIARAPFLGSMHNALRIAPGGLAIGSPLKQSESFEWHPVSLTEALLWLEVIEPIADGARNVADIRKELLAWAAAELDGIRAHAAGGSLKTEAA